jgi:hypothetical protein
MRTCREVSRLISESMDRRLPFGQRVGLRIHISMCRFCSRYRRQLILIREAMRRYLDVVEPSETFPSMTLSNDARRRILQTVASASEH